MAIFTSKGISDIKLKSLTIFEGYILVILTYWRLYSIQSGTIWIQTISRKVHLWNPYWKHYLLPATQAKFLAINYSAEEKLLISYLIWGEHQKPFIGSIWEFPPISKNNITYWFYKVKIFLNLWNGKFWSSDTGIDNVILWFRLLLCVLDSSRNTQERLETHLQNTYNILENLMKWSRYWWHLTWNVCIFKKSNFEKNIVHIFFMNIFSKVKVFYVTLY